MRNDRLSGAPWQAKNGRLKLRTCGSRTGRVARNVQEVIMNLQTVSSSERKLAIAASVALCIPLSGLAQDSVASGTLTVSIFAEQYVAAGLVLPSLDAVQTLAQPMRPRTLRLDLCDPTASRRLLAAGYRFRDVYLEMNPVAAGTPVCNVNLAARAVRVSGATGQPPERTDDAQTIDRYWAEMLP